MACDPDLDKRNNQDNPSAAYANLIVEFVRKLRVK